MEAAQQRTEMEEVRRAVAAFVAAGADESVQQVITSVHRLSRRLNQWYDRQFADLGVSTAEWVVLGEIARSSGQQATPGQLASVSGVAPSSMTHRLDRMVERGLIVRQADRDNRTRVLITLSDAGWQLYERAIREADLVETNVLAGLTTRQVEQLGGLLEKVLTGIDDTGL